MTGSTFAPMRSNPNDMSPRWWRPAAFMLFCAVLVLMTACVPGGGEDPEDVAAFAATTTLPDDATPRGAVWRCGEVKQAVYRSVAALSALAAEISSPSEENETPDDDPESLIDSSDLHEAVQAAARGLSSEDQAALNAACELTGQHDAALELWADGNRGDACDVWRPAHQSAQRVAFDINLLHPLSSELWVAATGSVAEGHGRCIAERAN